MNDSAQDRRAAPGSAGGSGHRARGAAGFGVVLVGTDDTDAVASRVRAYGPVAVRFHDLAAGHALRILGPYEGWTLVAPETRIGDYHLLNLVSWLGQLTRNGPAVRSLGVFGSSEASSPTHVVEVDPEGGGELLSGFDAGGASVRLDLSAPETVALKEPGAPASSESSESSLRPWLEERGVPRVLHELPTSEAADELGTAHRVELTDETKAEPPLETPLPSPGVRRRIRRFLYVTAASALGLGILVLLLDTLVARILAGLACAYVLWASIHLVGILRTARGRPWVVRIEESGELVVERVVGLWRVTRRLDMTELGLLQVVRPRRRDVLWLRLHDANDEQVTSFPIHHLPCDLGEFVATLAVWNPDLQVEQLASLDEGS